MSNLWIALALIALGIASLCLIGFVAFYYFIKWKLYPYLPRIFQETPLFIIPKGQPVDHAEDVAIRTDNGLELKGCYLPTTATRRKGVILFGLEFGSNRWACVPYCEFLSDSGFDIFAFEFRNQGDSEKQEGYEPMQWLTEYEVNDMKAAIAYLKNRPDADPAGIGFFGLSKGGSAGLVAAAADSYVRCFVTDGIFATHTTMLPYMRKWISIYSPRRTLQKLIPNWYYKMFASKGLRHVEKIRNCRFPHLEHEIRKLAPRPLLMIHGEGDTYIKPEMARTLFDLAKEPKEMWLVKGAKHNQAFHVANEQYKNKVSAFFQSHLARPMSQLPKTSGALREAEAPIPAAASTY